VAFGVVVVGGLVATGATAPSVAFGVVVVGGLMVAAAVATVTLHVLVEIALVHDMSLC
jgi:hypothetical protein